MMRKYPRRLAAMLLPMLLAPGLVWAATAPAEDRSQGDGGVSPFYTWAGDIAATPGLMLRSEPLEPLLGLAGAGTQVRILYTSTDGMDGKTPVAVSGAYFAPTGTPPPSGWPLVAWAHGTTGVADTCAPSWNPRSQRDAAYLNTWLDQGYAVVATDYQGLGTPGPHPYLAVRAEAYGVLDSIRAVLHAFPDVANKIIVVGQSQGGQAAFATLGIAPAYAPDLNIRGGVATGVPFLGGPILPPPAPPPTGETPDPTVAYSLYIGIMIQQHDPTQATSQLVTPRAMPLFEEARTTCVGQLFHAVTVAGLNRANALTPAFRQAFAAVLPGMEYSTLHLSMPLFVGTGELDHDVPPAIQVALVRNACAQGSVIEAHLYAGRDHSGTVNAALKDSVPFVRKVLAGEPIHSVCEPVAE